MTRIYSPIVILFSLLISPLLVFCENIFVKTALCLSVQLKTIERMSKREKSRIIFYVMHGNEGIN